MTATSVVIGKVPLFKISQYQPQQQQPLRSTVTFVHSEHPRPPSIANSADTSGVPSNNRLLYLTRNDWALINARARRRKYALGEDIIRQGTLTDSLYIVREGEASVELAVSSRREVLATLGPDDICGDMAFLERGATTAAVVAKDTNVEADEITGADLRDLFQAFPRLASRFYHSLAVVLARRLRLTSKELAREMASSDRHRKATRT